MHGAQNTGLNAFTLSAKNAYVLVHARICNSAEASLPWNYCELILSLARASFKLSFAARPPAGSTKSVAWLCFLEKSVQIHASSWRGRRCVVAQALFNHPCWCGPHPVCLWSTHAWPRTSPSTHISIFAIVFAGFFTKEVVRQKIMAARDLIKCHPLTPELATELFSSRGMGVFRISAALIEWSERTDSPESCSQRGCRARG